jgi:hypothetical protein
MKQICIQILFCLFFFQATGQKKIADSIYRLVVKKATVDDCVNKKEALKLLEVYEIIRTNFPTAGITDRTAELKKLSNNIALLCSSSGSLTGSRLTMPPSIPCKTITIRTGLGGGVSTDKEVPLETMLWSMLSETQQQKVLGMLEKKDKDMIEKSITPDSKLLSNDINSFFKLNNYDIEFYKKIYDKTNSPLDPNFKLKKELEEVIKERIGNNNK